MKIRVKIKFNASIEKIESFGNWRYLVYLKKAKEDADAMDYFIRFMSKFLGADPKDMKYLGKAGYEEYLFET